MRIQHILARLMLIVPLFLPGCGAQPGGGSDTARSALSMNGSTQIRTGEEVCAPSAALASLRSERMRAQEVDELLIGPGDQLVVSATDLPEIGNVDVRVDSEGFVDFPLLGRIHVGGLTDSEVRELISDRAKVYQKVPRVHVFIQHFAARNVEVMGMVAQPGSYALESSNESLLSVLGRAGGIKSLGSEQAADLIILFPAKTASVIRGAPNTACYDSSMAAIDGERRCEEGAGIPGVSRVHLSPANPRNPGAQVVPIVVDLSKPTMASCLDTPARPGDVIMVPAAGQVGVYGWVSKPGSFDVTPGMTVLGAITAAGGAIFTSSAEVMRTEQGSRVSIPVDLSKVEAGGETDPAVQGGDIVLVKGSVAGAVPYALYNLFTKFGTGLYLSPLAF